MRTFLGAPKLRDFLDPGYLASGLFSADMTSEVRSLPLGAASSWPRTRKRVVLFAWSSMELARTLRP